MQNKQKLASGHFTNHTFYTLSRYNLNNVNVTENTLQHADDQSSLAGEGCDGDGVCLCRSTAVTIFTAQPVASHNLLVFTCTLPQQGDWLWRD